MEPFSSYKKHLPYFEDKYTFSICPYDRAGDVMYFIDKYWKEGHILARSFDFMKWQHYDKIKDRLNFIIAEHKQTKDIHAIYGFTLSSHFDPHIAEPILWGNIWKNAFEHSEPGLGMMVCWMAYDLFFDMGHVGLGLSQTAVKFSTSNNTVGIADQYFMLNPSKTHFTIAKNTRQADLYVKTGANFKRQLLECTLDDFELMGGDILLSIPPHKSKKYYINRFFKHPIYQYSAFIIKNAQAVIGIAFWRFCYHESARCIRIVDYFGEENALAGCLNGFVELLEKHDAEYIDFICVNMPQYEMESAGFINRKLVSDIIIPNYFEPFVPKNIDIYYSIDNYHIPTDKRIFKADSDQDRPS